MSDSPPRPGSIELASVEADLTELAGRLGQRGRVVVLTGAGVSAESGIPTFRGPEGFWTSGSRQYQPMELATWRGFQRDPATVWAWYLYRARFCEQASPNDAHRAIARWGQAWASRFLLVTQNVDGLHARAGSAVDQTYCVHGRIDRMRCSSGCPGLRPLPPIPDDFVQGSKLGAAEVDVLHCADCGDWLRPHVLWFDEYYDEQHYRMDSALEWTAAADLMVTVGSSGATHLPLRLAELARDRGAAIIDVNPERNPFSELALSTPRGLAIRGPAGFWLPRLAAIMLEHSEEPS